MAEAPADLAGLHDRGRIAVGAEASFSVFAPDERFTVDAEQLHHKNPVCAYDGRRLFGVVRSTWLHGRQLDLNEPRGRLLQRRPP
jgi:allantoinase